MTLNYMIFMVMPGDPTTLFINPQKKGNMTEVQDQMNRLREMWGINDPPAMRFLKYIKNMLTWNFGITFADRTSVAEEMMWRLPFTLMLMGGSTILALVIGVAMGALAAHRRGGKFDTVSVLTSLVFYSLPTFWMGMVFILIFYSNLHWFPHAHARPAEWALNWPVPFNMASSSSSLLGVIITINPSGFLEYMTGYLRHAFLPVFTLTLFQYGGYLLLVRATMVEALTEDYIVTARAKGVSETNVVFKHALKNASLPLITSAALSFGFLLSGAIITEGVYSWPGLGRWIFDAIGYKDFNILQALFYIIAVCVILANFIADLLYGVIDPRIKY
jgi:peptide/nickel transport system permease protein